MAFVYWIHLASHTDMLTQGYIGVTKKTVKMRYSEHCRSAKKLDNCIIYKAINKHGKSLIVTTLVEADILYCYDLELKLRPEPCIGWNINRGGSCAPMTGKQHTEKTIQKMVESQRARREKDKAKKDKAILPKQASVHKELPLWLRKHYSSWHWAKANDVYTFLQKDELLPHTIFKKLNIPKKLGLSIISKIKTGWIPENDPSWLQFART